MKFKEAFEHYRAGTASEVERQLVEEELEKRRFIDEYLDEKWDEILMVDEAPASEMKKVRKNLRKRSIILVLVSIVLAGVLYVGTVCMAIPSSENQYWNPEEDSFQCEYATNDLELTLAAYSELFLPDQSVVSVSSTHTGFAAYDIKIQYSDVAKGLNYYSYGTIEKNVISISDEWKKFCPLNYFENACYPPYPLDEDTKQEIYEKLSKLPDYIRLKAAVSFTEDMNMEELIAFEKEIGDANILWVGIRNCPENVQRYPLVGMAPYAGGMIREGINDNYPYFEIKGEEKTAANLRTHFKSLLQFSLEREVAGRGTGYPDKTYYEEVLEYVENNGIWSYGCYIVGTPQLFLELLDSGAASQVRLQNAWIDI